MWLQRVADLTIPGIYDHVLQLAEADTAILVTAKQQLQLDNHDLNALVKSLKMDVEKLQHQAVEKEASIAVLKRSNSISEVSNVSRDEYNSSL